MSKAIGAILGVMLAAVILSLPLAWMVMLALGNLGVHMSFIGSIPIALVVSAIGSKAISQAK